MWKLVEADDTQCQVGLLWKATFCLPLTVPPEIPRPAGENAVLRDDAVERAVIQVAYTSAA
jgi:hypothetical protein